MRSIVASHRVEQSIYTWTWSPCIFMPVAFPHFVLNTNNVHALNTSNHANQYFIAAAVAAACFKWTGLPSRTITCCAIHEWSELNYLLFGVSCFHFVEFHPTNFINLSENITKRSNNNNNKWSNWSARVLCVQCNAMFYFSISDAEHESHVQCAFYIKLYKTRIDTVIRSQ